MRLALSALLLLVGTAVQAGDKSNDTMAAATQCPEVYMAAVYVAQQTNFELMDWCPRIIYHSDSPYAQGRVADFLLLDRKGVGFYPDTGAILLPISLDLKDPGDFSLFLHQVVRAYQMINHADLAAPCNGALTAQAFEVQGQFLSDNGLESLASESFLSAKYRGTCGPARPVN